MKYKNCLQVVTSLNFGGTEHFLLKLLRGLKDDYNFYVAYLKERGPVADEIEKLSIPVFQVHGVRDLTHFLREHPVDIVHTHLYRANIIGRLAAKRAGVRKIISSQRSLDGWKSFYHVWLDRWTARYANVIIANSQAARDILVLREKIPAAKIKVVYNGLDEMPDLSRPELVRVLGTLQLDGELPLVGCITRFHREKGSHYLPEIISRVVRKKPQVKFILVGDGPFRASLAAEIKKRRLEEAVRFTGFQHDIVKYISLLDVFFLPSQEESFPQALLEALGAGVPSVCTDVGGVREIITPGETGLLVKPGDPGAMADGILWLLDHNEEAQKMSEQGKKAVKRSFRLDDKIRQIKDIYG